MINMGILYFLIGASGSGKTTAVKILERKKIPNLQICYFDSIGVPSSQQMIKKYGSVDEWQRAKTIEWIKKIKDNYLKTRNVVLDGQTRPVFIDEACKKEKIDYYEIILFDCNDEIRNQRLIARGEPQLANDTMKSWSRYLRKESISRRCHVIDTSDSSAEQSVSRLLNILV